MLRSSLWYGWLPGKHPVHVCPAGDPLLSPSEGHLATTFKSWWVHCTLDDWMSAMKICRPTYDVQCGERSDDTPIFETNDRPAATFSLNLLRDPVFAVRPKVADSSNVALLGLHSWGSRLKRVEECGYDEVPFLDKTLFVMGSLLQNAQMWVYSFRSRCEHGSPYILHPNSTCRHIFVAR